MLLGVLSMPTPESNQLSILQTHFLNGVLLQSKPARSLVGDLWNSVPDLEEVPLAEALVGGLQVHLLDAYEDAQIADDLGQLGELDGSVDPGTDIGSTVSTQLAQLQMFWN